VGRVREDDEAEIRKEWERNTSVRRKGDKV
jgi:hypothetical protein